ncbi:MAG: hypothetical protein UZ21_OP11001000776 [Microgenomates bacterium OLB22]|nr:MAG: hypothetical protein UZ21_OP11001000776 [Microgenomates bacterium OLB22]
MKLPLLLQYGFEVVQGKQRHPDPVRVPNEFWALYSTFNEARINILTWIHAELEDLVRILDADQRLYDLLPTPPPRGSSIDVMLNYLAQAEVAIKAYSRDVSSILPHITQHDDSLLALLPLWIECRRDVSRIDRASYEILRKDIEESYRLLRYLKNTSSS